MQLITFISAAALAATVTAISDKEVAENRIAPNLMKQTPDGKGMAYIHNRCDYDVNLWSVCKNAGSNIGCPLDAMYTLKKGETYHERFHQGTSPEGVSIKISKTNQCSGVDITQFEYYLTTSGQWASNYIDVSYVNCGGNQCPTINEGYYLQAGDQKSVKTTANSENTHNPVLKCTDRASCSKISYINPEDIQTKSCELGQDVHFYMCGGEAPSANDNKPANSAAPKPSPSKAASSSAANYKAITAAVTNAPEYKDAHKTPKVKTNVVYVTEYKYVEAKRHEHAHARRHQVLRA